MAAMAAMPAPTPIMEKASAGVRELFSAFSGSEARYFEEERFSEGELRKLLSDSLTDRKIDAMKRILAAVSYGRDCSMLFPDVVKNVSFPSLELKKLIYIYLVQYAENNRDLALLSINSFQRDLNDRSQLVRASALRAMASLKVLEVIQLVMVAVRTASNDTSPYVRKTAAQSTTKVYGVDPDQFLELRGLLLKLMSDREVTVVGSAVMAFHHLTLARPPSGASAAAITVDEEGSSGEALGTDDVVRAQLSHLHPHFRRLCQDVLVMDAWAQQCCIDLLTRYCRAFFASPEHRQEGTDSVPEDLELFIKSLTLLLNSSSKGVTLQAVVALCYLAPFTDLKVVVMPALRCIRQAPPEIARALLVALLPIVEARPDLLRPSIRDFFAFSFDFDDVKRLKLEIVQHLTDETNVQLVLRELQAYISWQSNAGFVALAVRALTHIALKIPSVSDTCLRGLVKMLDSRCEVLSCEAVVALRALLQRRRETKDSGLGSVLPHLAHHLQDLRAPTARASVVWIIGQYQREVPRLAPDVVRKLAKGFAEERQEVKQQILGLALKVWAFHTLNASGEMSTESGLAYETSEVGDGAVVPRAAMAPEDSAKVLPRLESIVEYLSGLAAYDAAWDVRDAARALKKLRELAKASLSSGSSKTGLGVWYCKACLGLGAEALGPSVQSVTAEEARGQLQCPWILGSLAQALDFPLETYRPLPSWADADSPDELRKPKAEVAPKPEAPKSISSSNVSQVQHIENRVQAPSNITNMPVVSSLEDLDLFYSSDAPVGRGRGPAAGAGTARGSPTHTTPAVVAEPPPTLEQFSLAARQPPAIVGTAVFGEDDESDEDQSEEAGEEDDDWKYCAQASVSPPVPSTSSLDLPREPASGSLADAADEVTLPCAPAEVPTAPSVAQERPRSPRSAQQPVQPHDTSDTSIGLASPAEPSLFPGAVPALASELCEAERAAIEASVEVGVLTSGTSLPAEASAQELDGPPEHVATAVDSQEAADLAFSVPDATNAQVPETVDDLLL